MGANSLFKETEIMSCFQSLEGFQKDPFSNMIKCIFVFKRGTAPVSLALLAVLAFVLKMKDVCS